MDTDTTTDNIEIDRMGSATERVNLQLLGEKDPQRRLGILNNFAEERNENLDYRPNGVFVVKNNLGEILLSRPTPKPKNGLSDTTGMWCLPQGGIEPGEGVDKNVINELSEEHFVDPKLLVDLKHGISDIREVPNNRPDKRGFTEGKVYIPSEVTYT